MMKKVMFLALVLAIAAPALADDIYPAVFRGLEGSTFSHWTYDDPCGVYDSDIPEVSSFVPHPLKEDPWTDPCNGSFSGQWWGSNIEDADPCNPWIPTAFGRDGLVEFAMGSWDINNFVHDQPAKDIWMQITYYNGGTEPTEFGFGAGYSDPDASDMGYWEGLTDPYDPCSFAEHEGPLDEWPTWAGDPLETWPGEGWVDGELVSTEVLGDGWIHDVYAMTLPLNPDFEYVEGGWFGGTVLIDQVVIETLCYVPEPATMVLLGLGSLLMIRRKR